MNLEPNIEQIRLNTPRLILSLFIFATITGSAKDKPDAKKQIAAPQAYTINCAACHLLNEVQVGPSLVEIAALYPSESEDYFIDWCVNPGKKRPEMAQMPSMAHIPKEDLSKIHDYILKVTKGLKPQKNHPKKDLFKNTERPRIIRTFLPHTGPASVLVALPGKEQLNLVWDSTLCRLRYLSQGEPDNWPYLRSNGNSLSSPGKDIIYTENAFFKTDQPFQYNGYYLRKDKLPTFLYSLGNLKISETIKIENGTITRTFSGSAKLPDQNHQAADSTKISTTISQESPTKITLTHALK